MTDLFDVFLQGLQEYEDIVQVDEYVVVVHIAKDIVYESLEYGGRIREPKWHHAVLVMPTRGVKHCLPLITLSNPDQVVGIAEVQLCEKRCRAVKVEEMSRRG